MSLRLLHLSDLHFLNNSRLNEFREYLNLLESILQTLEIDYIVVTGDIFHSKTNLTPDVYQLAFEFFQMISKYAKVKVILGNHDLAERNLTKLDALSPIFNNIDTEHHIHFHKLSVDSKVPLQKYVFRSYSLLDRKNWNWSREGIPEDTCLIGLYHGPIKGASTDIGYIFEHGEDVNKFDCLDIGLLGDIHKLATLGNKNHLAYAGSFIQNNMGESLRKGCLYWEIDGRNSFKKTFIEIPNIYPYITLNIGDELPVDIDKIKGARVRVLSDKSLNETNEYISYIKGLFKDKLISLVKVNKPKQTTLSQTRSNILSFNDYIDKRKNKVLLQQIHEQYLTKLNINNNVTNWKIKNIKWNNLFSYGEGNEIDFDQYTNQAILIGGANFQGKTSILHILTFALFGTWTNTGFVKAIHYINDLKDKADCIITLNINGKDYTISRTLERVKKGKKIDCNATVDFMNVSDGIDLNGDTKPMTQVSINNLIGSIEDFTATSLSTQFNNFTLIDALNSKRKEYFSRFLGITQYEEIYDLVKEDLKELANELKVLNNFGYKSNVVYEYTEFINEYENVKSILDQKRKDLYSEFDILSIKISNNNAKEKERSKISFYYLALEKQINSHREKINNLTKQLQELKTNNKGIVDFDQTVYDELKKQIANKQIECKDCAVKLKSLQTAIQNIEKAESLIASVPCGTQFLTCKFLVDAAKTVATKKEIQEQILNAELEKTARNLELLNLGTEFNLLEQVKFLYDRGQKQLKEIALKEAQLADLQDIDLAALENELAGYSKQLELYVNIWNDCKPEDLDVLRELINQKNIELSALTIKYGLYKKQLSEIMVKNCRIKELEINYQLLLDYSEIVGKNGIIIDILNSYLPAITQLTNEIITNIAEFNIDIFIEDNKYIEIYIQDAISKRPIECASGSQKTIVALALRLAILNYSQICSSDLMILDEPATALDTEHLLQFNKLLDIIKAYNKTILLVTHIAALKDSADKVFTVSKDSGYSILME